MMRLDIAGLRAAYLAGRQTPQQTIEEVLQRIARAATNPVWISRVDETALFARAAELQRQDPATLPLYGLPFAIKDNIDLAGLPTTAACPAFAYQPAQSAAVVQRLLDAGAIAIGKTNLDQFATGLVGTRSPYGIVRNSFDARYLAGGSSSGSAVAVALGQVSFALGTDTAGSGRVPAAFNNLVGYKPTLGLIATRGMVPACRTLDAVSIFALTAADAACVMQVARGFDAADPWSRPAQAAAGRGWSQRPAPRIAVPSPAQREFFGNAEYARLFAATIGRCAKLGADMVETDIAPLLEAARLLYAGPWVAERYLVARDLLQARPEALHPATRAIIQGGATAHATDAFMARYRLQELAAAARGLWSAADALLLPTAPTHFTIEEDAAEPMLRNSQLGTYTNFVNLLDLAAVALPGGFTAGGLPFGVTLLAPAWHDEDLLAWGARLHAAAGGTLGATGLPWPQQPATIPAPSGTIDIAVCGAHLSGLPLNHQLTGRGAWLVAATRTAPEYRLYALPGGPPQRPGMVRTASHGTALEIEIWRMPEEHFASFMRGIPAPLGLGRVRVQDGAEVCGFLCEPLAIDGARDISDCGGWRAWLARQGPAAP
ncbi:MAG TPA: allophanate hydrolase [Steroidobacteraceae bacterium]|nr:allophanate hydrolase [Steroidobacteraceae bacterium]